MAEVIPNIPKKYTAKSSMSGVTSRLARFISAFYRVISSAANIAVLLVVVGDVLLVLSNVVMRNVFQSSILYTDEVSVAVLTFLAFVGGAQAYRSGHLVGLSTITTLMPGSVQRGFRLLAISMTLLTAVCLIVASTSLMNLSWGNSTLFPILGIASAWLQIPVVVGSTLLALYALENLFRASQRIIVAALLGSIAIGFPFILGGPLDGTVAANTARWVTIAVVAAAVAIGTPIAIVLGITPFLFFGLSGLSTFHDALTFSETGVSNFILVTVPFFVLAGLIMANGEISQRIVDLMTSLVGRARGGLLQVCVVAMFLISGMSGSKAGDIAAVGSGLSGRLEEKGYSRSETAAVLASSAAMGETIPPSVAILIMASLTNLSVLTMFLAGIVPAIFLGICLMFFVWLRARKQGFIRGERSSRREIGTSLRRAIIPLTLPILLFVVLFGGITGITEGSAVMVVYGFLLSLMYRNRIAALKLVAEGSIALIGMVMFLIACGAGFSTFLTYSGIAAFFESALKATPGGSTGFVLAAIVVLIISGSLFEGLPALLVFTPILMPLAMAHGLDPVYFAIVILIAQGIGFFLPPVGLGAFIACSVAGSTVERTTRPLLYYLTAIVAGCVVIGLVPAITLALPHAFGRH